MKLPLGLIKPVLPLVQPDYRILWSYKFFIHGVMHQVKIASETTTLVECDQLVSHSFRLQDFLIINFSGKNQYLRFFLHGVSHQGKVAAETITFGWLWSFVSLNQSERTILWSATSLERTSWYVWFLT